MDKFWIIVTTHDQEVFGSDLMPYYDKNTAMSDMKNMLLNDPNLEVFLMECVAFGETDVKVKVNDLIR